MKTRTERWAVDRSISDSLLMSEHKFIFVLSVFLKKQIYMHNFFTITERVGGDLNGHGEEKEIPATGTAP